MRRFGLVGVVLVVAGWAGVIGAQALGDPAGRAGRLASGLVASLTAGCHLIAAAAAGCRPGGRALERGAGWASVQAERHRRSALRFAAWGLGASALAGLMAWSAPAGLSAPAWAPPLLAGANLGLQPGLLLAEVWAIMARGRSAPPLT